MRTVFRVAAVAAAAVMALAVSACSSSTSGADATSSASTAPVDVSFALPVSAPDAGSAVAYLMPEWAGFFEQEGLNVQIVPNDGGTSAMQQVATGNAQFSVNNPQALINAVGEGLGVTGVATVIPRQIYNFYVLPGSSITSVADLKGKKIGISSPTSGVYPFAQTALAEAGIDYQHDATLVTTGSGGPQLQALLSGQVDAIATWDTVVATFANMGTELTALPPGSVASLPADVLITNTRYLMDHPDVVARFGKAMFEAIAYSQAHPDEVVADFIKNQSGAAGDDPAQDLKVVQARLDTLALSDEQKKLGDVWMDGYQQLQDTSVKFGAITTAQDLSKVFDLTLLPQMQDFDSSQFATPTPTP